MKFTTTLAAGFVAAMAACLSASPASAAFILSFDENGNGCLENSDHNCTTPVVGTLEADPTGRVAGDVLVYQLPETVTTGDVGVGDFGTNTLSDVLTFTNANGDTSGAFDGNLMIFYSELGGSDLADTGFPDQAFTIFVTENADGSFTYSPFPNVYVGSSPEGVPEPLTLSLFGAGLVGAAALRRRKAKST